MRNYLGCLVIGLFCSFYPLTGMLVTQQQFLQKDLLQKFQWKCDIQSMGRLASTCKYIRDNYKVENFPLKRFDLIEKYLYHDACKLLSLKANLADLHIEQALATFLRLCIVIDTQEKQIDTRILSIHSYLQAKGFESYFYETLELTNDDRIAFYYGKLPGQKPLYTKLSEYSSDSQDEDSTQECGDPSIDDVLEAAYEDTRLAIFSGDIERVKVLLKRYEQFPNHGNELMSSLCGLSNGPLLVNYLSIPERGIENAKDSAGCTAIEIAEGIYEDQELLAFLQHAIDNTNK